MSHAESIDSLAYDIAFWMQGFDNAVYPANDQGPMCVELCMKLRAIAIMVLLSEGNSESFLHNLVRSGRLRLHYLNMLREQGLSSDHHSAAGRFEPLADSIAAGDFGLAREIAAVSRLRFFAGHEYMDDFCFAQILQRLVVELPQQHSFDELIEMYEAFLEGEPDARLEVCKALIERDQPMFDEYFPVWLDQRAQEIKDARARGKLEEYDTQAINEVFVEGLAVLRLAGLVKLDTLPHYAMCPALARRNMRAPLPPDPVS